MKRTIVFILLAALLLSVVAGCSKKEPVTTDSAEAEVNQPKEGDEKEYTLKIPLVLNTEHPHYIALDTVFKKEVEEKTGGKVKVELYPNSALGNDRETFEAMVRGTLPMTAPSVSVMPGFNEKFYVLDLPFLFTSAKAARNALDGDLGKVLDEEFEKLGAVNLYWGESGFRNLTNNVRPVTKPEDMSGMKLRTMENTYHLEAFKSWGSNPTPMAFGDLFTALQNNTVAGQDNGTVIIYSSRFFEVQKYLSVTEHIYGANCTLINKKLFDEMSPEYQQILRDAAVKTRDEHRRLIDEQDIKMRELLEENGMQINILTPEQKAEFAEAAEGVIKMFSDKYGADLIELARKYND